jgi:hypothetical protein
MILSWEHYNPIFLMRFLHPPARIVFFLLVSLLIYTIYFVTIALFRLRSIKRVSGNTESVRRSLRRLDQSANHLNHLIRAFFFLFGLIFCVQLPDVFTLPYSTSPTRDLMQVAEKITSYSEFASDAFAIFFVVQCLQWFISSRIKSAVRLLLC